MALCLSVSLSHRLSQAGVLSKLLNESSWFLARDLTSTCVKRKFEYLQKSVLSSGTLSQTLDLENFASAYRSSKRVIEKGGRSERDKLDRRWSIKAVFRANKLKRTELK